MQRTLRGSKWPGSYVKAVEGINTTALPMCVHSCLQRGLEARWVLRLSCPVFGVGAAVMYKSEGEIKGAGQARKRGAWGVDQGLHTLYYSHAHRRTGVRRRSARGRSTHRNNYAGANSF